MSWSYTGNPTSSPKDEVRFLIGDTSSTDPLLQDEEINYVIAKFNGAMAAAIQCCESIQAKFARMANEAIGQVKIDFNDKAKGYSSLRDQLRNRLALGDTGFYAGGISQGDKDAITQNTDRVKPKFSKDQQENEQIAPWVTANNIGVRGSDEP